MSDQEINSAIAKAVKWEPHRRYWKLSKGEHGNAMMYFDTKQQAEEYLEICNSDWTKGFEPFEVPINPPCYCDDLNLMHNVLKTLKPDQLWDVAYSLPMETMLGFMATARELAETFLMVIGKWEATTEESSADHLRDATKMMEEVLK